MREPQAHINSESSPSTGASAAGCCASKSSNGFGAAAATIIRTKYSYVLIESTTSTSPLQFAQSP